MLARYHIVRGKRDPTDPLPEGRRIDVRKHTGHFLSPDPGSVESLLEQPDAAAFVRFERDYRQLLSRRFAEDRAPFDELAALAKHEAVFLGCNCPTKKQPEVMRCHTVLALRFMKRVYPSIKVELPRA